ncbi:MAG: hypothetical protein QM831_35605 [Kofleriaceae bacterium]
MKLVITILIAVTATAHAGLFCDEENKIPNELKALELYAKNKTETPDLGYVIYCLGNDPAKIEVNKRTLAACEKILDRDPSSNNCNTLVAKLGQATLGAHDIFAWVAKRPLDPQNSNSSDPNYPLYLFRDLADVRASKIIVDKWNALIPIEAKHEKSHEWMAEWSGWRQHAAEALGTSGDADAATFLKDQATQTKDSHVKDACLEAAAAIEKRLAK